MWWKQQLWKIYQNKRCKKMVMVASKIYDINFPSCGLLWVSGSDLFIVKLWMNFYKSLAVRKLYLSMWQA
jgi:hypothetical protein